MSLFSIIKKHLNVFYELIDWFYVNVNAGQKWEKM